MHYLHLCYFHVYKWEKAYIKDLCAWRIWMNFFMYLFRWRKWGGGGVGLALKCMYMCGNTLSAFLTEPIDGYLWNLVGIKCSWSLTSFVVFGQIHSGADLEWGKNRSWGPLLHRSSLSDWKATATNRMHSNDLEACGMKCCNFWFHSEVKFLMRFWHLFGLSHFCLILMQSL